LLRGLPDNYTKLLLHFDGADGSQVFVDSSAVPKAVTAGGTAQIDTAQSVFGGASGLFDGDSDYLTVPDSDDWAFGAGDFTIDGWFRLKSGAENLYFDIYDQYDRDADTGIRFRKRSTNEIVFSCWEAGVAGVTFESVALSWVADTWYHIAIVRYGNIWTIYRDGISVATTTVAYTIPNFALNIALFAYLTGVDYYLNGWVDEFRISKGIARWTGNFVPPQHPY
jgi:hypothetical protein